MRLLRRLALAFLLIPFAALAQGVGPGGGGTVGPGGPGGGGCTTNCTFNGTTTTAGIADTGGINTTSLFQQNGVTVLNQVNAVSGSLVIGSGAGASLPAGSIFSTFIGQRAGNAFTGATGEATCVGTVSCPVLVNGTFDTALGEHSMGSEISASSSTSLGNDNMRDYVSTGPNTSTGKSAMTNGGGTHNAAYGFETLGGNSGNITFGGTAANDTISLTFTGTYTGSPQTVPVTITTGMTAAQMATAAANAINANATLFAAFLATNQGTSGGTVVLNYPGTSTTGLAITVTASGNTTETVAITGGVTGGNNAVYGDLSMLGLVGMTTAGSDSVFGTQSFQNPTTASADVIFGDGAGNAISSAIQDVCVGSQVCPTLGTGAGNFIGGYKADVTGPAVAQAVIIGGSASAGGPGARCGQTYVCVGANVGSANVTGQRGVVIGQGAGAINLGNGFGNVLIGWTVDMPTGQGSGANWVNVNNALYSQAVAPTIVSGFGTTPSVSVGATTAAFQVTVGTGGTANTGVVAVSTVSAPHGWACSVTDNTNPGAARTVSVPLSTLQITLNNYSAAGTLTPWTAGDVLTVGPCLGF